MGRSSVPGRTRVLPTLVLTLRRGEEPVLEVIGGEEEGIPADLARAALAALRRHLATDGGQARLSARERTVLGLLARGHSYKTAAAELHLGIDTIRHHVRRLYAKLGVHTKSEAVAEALRRGLLS